MKNWGKFSAAVLSTSLALGTTQTQAAEEGEWEFAVAPMYLWAKAIDATTSAAGRESSLDLDFKNDILENLDSAFAIHFEARKDKLGLFLEYNFASLDPSVEGGLGPIELNADITYDDTMWEGGVTWAFAESDSTRWEVIGGLRYYEQDLELKLQSSGPGLLPSKTRVGDDWVHPFGGVRVITKMTDRWTFRVRADVGYEDSHNRALQGILTFDYRFRDWGSAFVGYRYLDMDFDNTSSGRNQYSFDGDQAGPLVGINFYF